MLSGYETDFEVHVETEEIVADSREFLLALDRIDWAFMDHLGVWRPMNHVKREWLKDGF